MNTITQSKKFHVIFFLLFELLIKEFDVLTIANTEVVTDDEDGLQHVGSSRPPDVKKKKGILGLFGK